MKRAKRLLTGVLAVFFGLCTVGGLWAGQFKGVGLFFVFTVVFGAYAIYGDAAFKKPQ